MISQMFILLWAYLFKILFHSFNGIGEKNKNKNKTNKQKKKTGNENTVRTSGIFM